jgi:hypothetical protein
MYAMFFLDPIAGNANQTPPAPPLESEKLTELKNKLVEQDAVLVAAKTFDERMKAMGDLMKTQADISTEEAAIKKANVEALKKAAADKKVAMVTDFEAAVLADAAIQSDKKSTDEAKAESAAKLTGLRDALKNEVLGNVKIAPAVGATVNAGGSKGETGKAIIALHEENLAAGMTPTESKKKIGETINPKTGSVYARGTIGAEVLAWEKSNGAK